jgi:tetratricopeptide (TPR) repeat protein
VQEQIARAIVGRLQLTLSGGERLVAQHTTNIEAYQLLLKGREFLTRRGPGIVHAITCFEEAIALDANLSAAHAGLADTYRLMSIYELMPSDQVMPKARVSLERALALDPNQADALATLANIKHVCEWDFTASRTLTERALAADPVQVRAMAESAIMIATAMADPPAAALTGFALDRIAQARKLDPLNAWAMAMEALVLTLLGRPADGEAAAKRAIETNAGTFTAHWGLVTALAALGRDADARHAASIALAMSGRHHMILAEVAALDAAKGDRAAAEAIFRELDERARTGYISFAAQAAVAASAGLFDEARSRLVRAIDARDAYLTFYKLPAWRPLRRDPACAAILGNISYVKNALK